MQTEKVTVFVDTDNIAFIDTAVCAKYPHARFHYYTSYQRNLPFVDKACARCANADRRNAPYAGSDVCDVMILFDIVRAFDARALIEVHKWLRTGKRKLIVVSGDKLLANAERLLPGVSYVGALAPLAEMLEAERP